MSDFPLLHLVRHGETNANLAGRYAGWSDDRLNERGRSQCAELAASLAGEGVDALFTSPVRRAVETAEILAASLAAPVRTVRDLREIEPGPWKGLTEEEVSRDRVAEYEAWRRAPHTLELPGRESLAAVLERSLGALGRIARDREETPEVPALVVTHLAVIRVVWLTAGGRPLSEYHTITGPHCRSFPVRCSPEGRVERAGPGPTSPRDRVRRRT